MDEPKITRDDAPIWTWVNEGFSPSMYTVMETLRLCFSLLADSLPLALKGLKEASPQEQVEFWRAFICLDEATEFASRGFPDDTVEKWVEALNDYYSIAEELSHPPDTLKPLCDTTMTPRNPVDTCVCIERTDEMGPCGKFEQGGNGKCVYCDHEWRCHPYDTGVL